MKILTVSALLTLLVFTSAHAKRKSWARLTGCTWIESPSNDGDSFHAKYQGKEFIFRLYFVDTCETSEQIPARVREQGEQLGITRDRVLAAGNAAKELTHRQLAGRPFTVVTCWEDARGASRLPRNYAFVLYGNNNEHDLASTLAQNGLVRIYGMPAEPPGSTSSKEFRAQLLKLEASAKQQKLGIYGNLSTTTAANTQLNTGAAGAPSPATGSKSSSRSSGGYVPVSFLFPAKSRAPQVVDNPADDLLSDYSVESAEAPTIIQGGIPEDDYSEVPGWKPPAKTKKAAAPDGASPDAAPVELPD